MNVCQVCGGNIHPLAGRCKHCKTDLSTQRTSEAGARRAAAATPVPAPVQQAGSQPAQAPVTRAASQPASNTYYQPSGWRRRWPLAVAAVALVAISFSAGMLIERSGSSDNKSHDGVENTGESTDTTSPKLGGPHGNQNSTQSQASLPTTAAPAVGAFQGVVISAVCRRLHKCGMLNDFSKQMCEEMASKVTDPTASARVRNGQCQYNKSAASACLTTINKLKCDMNSSNVMDWVESAGKLADCTTAFSCK